MDKAELFENTKCKLNELIQKDGLIEDFETIGKYFYENVKNVDDGCKFYRYSPISTNVLDSLRSQMVYLAPLSIMNDVYEGLPFDPELENLSAKEMRYVGETGYIKAFSEDAESELMWAYYANDHKGICIEYDFKQLAVNTPWDSTYMNFWKHFFPIHYGKERIGSSKIKDIIREMRHMENDELLSRDHEVEGYIVEIYPLLLHKSFSWAHEKEWRLVFTKDYLHEESLALKAKKKDANVNAISIPCVSAVYLGYRVSDDDERLVKMIADSIGIPVKKEYLSGRNYRVSFRNVE